MRGVASWRGVLWGLGLWLGFSSACAETLDLEGAVALALKADQRIEERRQLVNAARALLAEAQGNRGLMVSMNSFVGLAPTYEDGFFTNGSETCEPQPCTLREGTYDLEGVSPWLNVEFLLVKPLYTFGKIEHYSAAAQGNIRVKQGEVRQQRIQTRLDVSKAYYGYLASRDARLLLEDVRKRINSARELLERWVEAGREGAKQSDLFSLETGAALLERYLAQARGLERVALDGLKVLTGVGLGGELQVRDRRIRPLALPQASLEDLVEQALAQRPEMAQLEAGLKARRALVEAKRADAKPNLYAGLGAGLSYAPDRYQVDNPYLYDPFNFAAVTPVVGIKWDFSRGVRDAKVAGAQAELDALIAKAAFAREGIPFQVAEQYHQVQAYREIVAQAERGSRAGRRWMISAYADFEAGLEESDEVVDAFKGYVMAHADYLLSTNDYNMHVIKLRQMIGAYE